MQVQATLVTAVICRPLCICKVNRHCHKPGNILGVTINIMQHGLGTAKCTPLPSQIKQTSAKHGTSCACVPLHVIKQGQAILMVLLNSEATLHQQDSPGPVALTAPLSLGPGATSCPGVGAGVAGPLETGGGLTPRRRAAFRFAISFCRCLNCSSRSFCALI